MDELLVRRHVDFNEVEAKLTPPLLIAVDSRNSSLLMTLIDAGANVNEEDDCGNTALINLLKNTRKESSNEEQLLKCVKVLTDNGADVNHTSKVNRYPLLISVQKKIPTVVRHLVQAGADVNRHDDRDEPILITAVKTLSNDIVSCLIDGGACVNCTDKMGVTVLFQALKLSSRFAVQSNIHNPFKTPSGQKLYSSSKNEIVKTLLNKGASLDCKAKDRKKLLHLAITSRDDELLRILIETGANVNILDDNLEQENMRSSINCNWQIAPELRICECEINPTPLHLCIVMEWESGYQILLDAGADITMKDIHGHCAIHYAARCRSEYFLRLLLQMRYTLTSDQVTQSKNHIELQRLKPDELNNQSVSNFTALHIAAAYNRRANVITLIKAGCNLNKKTQSGMTPLLVALDNRFDHVAKTLLEAGADINLSFESGESVFHLACKRNCCEAVFSMIKSGVDIHEINPIGQTVMSYAPNIQIANQLVNMGLDIHHRDYSSLTPLHAAAMNGNAELARLILSRGEDVNVVTNFGDTPLILAAARYRKEVVNVLHTFGADVNKPNNDGTTALIAYCKSLDQLNDAFSLEALMRMCPMLDIQDNTGSTALMYLSQINCNVLSKVKILLGKGATVNIRNKEGKTALMYSISFGFGHICSTLLKYGADPILGDLSQNARFHITRQADHFLGDSEILRLCLCNGIVFSIDINISTPILIEYMLKNTQMSRIRYLLANCCLGTRDLEILRSFDATTWRSAIGEESIDNDLLMRCRCEPWPLVKLAFITVSTLLGDTPNRQRRLEKTSLPVKLQEMLMFQTPLARLPVKEWSSIPLCFDPIEYERLLKPRPLLYYWPVGNAYC